MLSSKEKLYGNLLEKFKSRCDFKIYYTASIYIYFIKYIFLLKLIIILLLD